MGRLMAICRNTFKPEIENYLKLEDKTNTNVNEVARIGEKKSNKKH